MCRICKALDPDTIVINNDAPFPVELDKASFEAATVAERLLEVNNPPYEFSAAGAVKDIVFKASQVSGWLEQPLKTKKEKKEHREKLHRAFATLAALALEASVRLDLCIERTIQ